MAKAIVVYIETSHESLWMRDEEASLACLRLAIVYVPT